MKKAILLVGGKGTRLHPLTNTVPKPMIRIAGKPVTEHQIIKAR
ncbi:MAG: NDP-sugar synthase, partial [Actinomycetota bacterium]